MGLTKVGKRVVWDGPTRKAVPRKPLRDETGGYRKSVKMRRKVAENRYGGSGWEPSKVYKNKY